MVTVTPAMGPAPFADTTPWSVMIWPVWAEAAIPQASAVRAKTERQANVMGFSKRAELSFLKEWDP
jgi:hypothetical protein